MQQNTLKNGLECQKLQQKLNYKCTIKLSKLNSLVPCNSNSALRNLYTSLTIVKNNVFFYTVNIHITAIILISAHRVRVQRRKKKIINQTCTRTVDKGCGPGLFIRDYILYIYNYYGFNTAKPIYKARSNIPSHHRYTTAVQCIGADIRFNT